MNALCKRQLMSWCALLLVCFSGSACTSSGPSSVSTVAPTSLAPSSTRTASFTWPAWARTARIAGAYFAPDDSKADIATRLDALAAQRVSVVLADSPWGQAYSAWVDDNEFLAVQTVITTMVQQAHRRGLKVVMYMAGLELVSDPARNPGTERPGWPQRSLNGQAVLFNDISNSDEHWLNTSDWDLWLTPCRPTGSANSSFRELALSRVGQIVATGIDGLWIDQVYLPTDVGDHTNLWPSSDPCSAAAFRAATGLSVPAAEDWDDPGWRHWVVWRHAQLRDFLLALKEAARTVNPALVIFEENASADTSRATQNANDPIEYQADPDLSTGHEIETIGDRMDEGQTGMSTATLDQWLAFRTMIAFARGADRAKPSWILTYGYLPRDSAQLAGLVLAEGANFYETRGPLMDATVGEAYRTQLFGWIADHAADLYAGHSAAQVAVLYSPRSRDLLDSGSGSPYEVEDSVHFAAYRAITKRLYRAHIPFDVVLDTDTAAFNHYSILILPEVQLMSDTTADALRTFTGRLITIGSTGQYDEWMNERAQPALTSVPQQHWPVVSDAPVQAADTGLLRTNAPPSIQLGLRSTANGYAIIIANTAITSTGALTIDLQLGSGEVAHTTQLLMPNGTSVTLPSTVDRNIAHLRVPSGIDTFALLTLETETPNYSP